RTFVDYAPNGRPNMIASPGGGFTFLEYYDVARPDTSDDAVYGDHSAPSSGSFARSNAGLLARVTTNLYGSKDASAQGTGCGELADPFRGLAENCAGDPAQV